MNENTNTAPPGVEGVSGLWFDLKVTSVSSTLQTAAKQQQQQWRRQRSAPLSVIEIGRVHRLLVFVLVVLCADQPLAGEVFKDDVIVAEGKEGEGCGS